MFAQICNPWPKSVKRATFLYLKIAAQARQRDGASSDIRFSSAQHSYDLRRKPSHASVTSSSSSEHLFPSPPKRSRKSKSCSQTTSTKTKSGVGARYLQHELPDEVLLHIFSYLLEFDLCSAAATCKRFYTIAHDAELWKNLYQAVYEYDLPIVSPEPKIYQFVQPVEGSGNKWKESFIKMVIIYFVFVKLLALAYF